MALYRSGEFRDAFKAAMAGTASLVMGGWPKTLISFCPPQPALEERPLFEVAAERGLHPVDLLLDLALESDLAMRIRMPIANHDEDEVEVLLKDPNVVVGLSDGGAHASQLCDACFATYLLGHWVRERGSLDMEHAIWHLTARAAEVCGIADRGRLALGLAADVVVFDPETVGAGELQRVYDFPGGADRLISEASGIEAVIVNGALLRQHNRDMVDPAGPLPGRILRHGHG
jgi:N-acyl-D-aspartate/D-glutamate deacylase